MTSAQRIILNTFATYGRTCFAMLLGLFSSRWILQSLGNIDYGLMSVVGGLIMFVTFLNGVTAGSCARFFAYSMGRGDDNETNRWFNTALSVHFFLPTALVLIGWPLGEWAIETVLSIPSNRIVTAIWVFRFSLISAFFGMISTPYMGMFTAKQRIYEMSGWGILQSVLTFFLAFGLTLYQGDAWFIYSLGSVVIMSILAFGQILRAQRLFSECRIRFCFWWDTAYLKQLFTFAGWQLFGSFGAILRGQGCAILLNKYFPPTASCAVNASYALGNTIAAYTQTFSGALLGAFAPEITATEGRGDRQRMLYMANRVSKLGAFLVLLVAAPLMLEIDYILVIWLKDPPDLAGVFCRLILLQFFIDNLTYGHMVAVAANGKIAGYQMMLGSLVILTLPLAWFFLTVGYPAVSVGWAFIVTTSFLSIGRVFWAKHLIGLVPSVWVREVLFPIIAIGFFSAAIGGGVRVLINHPCFMRFFLVGFLTMSLNMALAWFFVFDRAERLFVMDIFQKGIFFGRKYAKIN